MRQLFSRRREMLLLIVATLIVAALLVNLELSQENTLTTEVAWIIGGFIGLFTSAHIALCLFAPYSDQFILPIAATLNGMGLVFIYRLDLANETSMASRQVLWTFVGVALFIAFWSSSATTDA